MRIKNKAVLFLLLCISANDEGNRTTPSWVAFTDNGPLIGEAAKNQAPLNAERTIFNVNCLIGKM
ncbi:hypothetical protein SLEP1_g23631 [Rubroshorea leprosula]|uniref:Uncharacterized protein n=1 Tax=Rubroshorea leprosula TaxID=152421 RepID=A0AAV5JLS8_9ROSI|nr:hypothetical protein SLEP1_g23631 [Rubroshorea leprosula]